MNLILLFPDDFVSSDRVRLADYRAKHIREIHRAYPGQTLKIGLANGRVGEGIVQGLDGQTVELEVQLTSEAPSPSNVSLVIALPRPQTLKKVLEVTAACGVGRVFLVDAERVEKGFFSSKLLKDNHWLRHVRLGLEQGGRTQIPEVTFHRSLRRFLSEELNEPSLAGTIRLVAHPSVSETLWQTPLARRQEITNVLGVVGPEGGWLDSEVEKFVSRGFQPVRLGSSILRVEYAVTSLLAQIEIVTSRQ